MNVKVLTKKFQLKKIVVIVKNLNVLNYTANALEKENSVLVNAIVMIVTTLKIKKKKETKPLNTYKIKTPKLSETNQKSLDQLKIMKIMNIQATKKDVIVKKHSVEKNTVNAIMLG